MLEVTIFDDSVVVGERFSLSFFRTLRIPDEDRAYPLPPGMGTFPIHPVAEYADRVPVDWREAGGVFVPMYQREALWVGFRAAAWKPNAVKVGVGRIDALTGKAWDLQLAPVPQNYLVCPYQAWLDGFRAGPDTVRQFVAMPLGSGYSVESQLDPQERERGGLRFCIFEPKAGRFPDVPPADSSSPPKVEAAPAHEGVHGEMAMAAGGTIRQKIYRDPDGVDTWDGENYGVVYVHIVNSEQYRSLTGIEPPTTPVSAQTYTRYGLPWFDVYDEDRTGSPGHGPLAGVRSVRQQDVRRGEPARPDDVRVEVKPAQTRIIGPTDPDV